MADFEKKETLITVEIDQKGAMEEVKKLTGAIIDQQDAISENNNEIKNLNKTNKDLEKEVKAGTITQEDANKAIDINTLKANNLKKSNFALKDGLKELNGERKSALKFSNLQSNSLDALRKKVADQKKELNGLNTATKEGAKRFDELTKELKANNESIKKADQSAGDFKTSIGDYTGGILDATKELGIFGKAQSYLTGIQDSARKAQTLLTASKIAGTKATSGASKALKLFKIALASTGLGLVVIALGALISYLTTTQEGIDKVTSVTRPLMAIFEKMKGVVQDLGGNVFSGLAQILNGDIKEGLKTLGSGFTQAFDDTTKAITSGIEAGTKLDKLTKEIEKSEISLTTTRAELNRLFAESQEIAKDTSKTENERLSAAKDAIKAQNDLLSAEQNFLDLKIERLKLEQSLNDTSREGELELSNLIAERTNFEADASKKRSAANLQLNIISKQIAGEEKARIKLISDANNKAREEKLAKDLAASKIAEELSIKTLENQRKLDAKLIDLATFRREKENEIALKAATTDDERFTLSLSQQNERFKIEQEQLAAQREIALENNELTKEEDLAIKAEFDLTKEELEATHQETIASIKDKAAKLAFDKKAKEDEDELNQEKRSKNNKEKLLNQSFATSKAVTNAFFDVKNAQLEKQYKEEIGNLTIKLNSGQITQEEFDKKKQKLDKKGAIDSYRLRKKQFESNRNIAVAESLMNTGKAVSAALTTMPVVPVGIAMGVLVGGLGLAQTVSIASRKAPQPPQFAKGGDVLSMRVGGNLHSAGGTNYVGEDGNTFNVERDEGIFVTKRSATNPALAILSDINQEHGGNSMLASPSRFLQEGGQASASMGVSDISLLATEIVNGMPAPIVEVTSIMAGITAESNAKEIGIN